MIQFILGFFAFALMGLVIALYISIRANRNASNNLEKYEEALMERDQLIDKYEEQLESFTTYYNSLREGLQLTLKSMRDVDIRASFVNRHDPTLPGAFEEDDEVGIVFEMLRDMVYSLDRFLKDSNEEKTTEDSSRTGST